MLTLRFILSSLPYQHLQTACTVCEDARPALHCRRHFNPNLLF